jgi:hypothetical protein
LKDHFDIIPYAYYLVPKLEHIDEYLDQCEKIIGKIYRYPSPSLYNRIATRQYQPPERITPLYELGAMPKITFDAISRCCEISSGIPENTWTAIGVRSADSIARAGAIKAHGAWNDKRRIFYPVWDWNKARLVDEMKKHNIKLSPEYVAYGRTFDGLFMLYAIAMEKHFPKDYQRVLEFFPFVELEVFRYKKALEKYGSEKNLPKPDFTPKPLKTSLPTPKFSFLKPKNQKTSEGSKKYSKLNAETKKADAKMQSMIHPEFWLSVYFPDQSRFQIVFEDFDQRDFLVNHWGVFRHGDKYIDGCFLNEHLKIKAKLPKFKKFSISTKKVKNPLDALSYSGDPEPDSYMELETIKDYMPSKPEFKNSQAEIFLKKAGWLDICENGNIYCHDLGIDFPISTYYYRPSHRPDPKLLQFV